MVELNGSGVPLIECTKYVSETARMEGIKTARNIAERLFFMVAMFSHKRVIKPPTKKVYSACLEAAMRPLVMP